MSSEEEICPDGPRLPSEIMVDEADGPDEQDLYTVALTKLLDDFQTTARWLPGSLEHATSAREVSVRRPSEAEDPLNAFIHRFSLPPAAQGPLSGWTVGVKDTIAIAGIPRTRGRLLNWDVPAYDATVVRRLLEAGAEIVGTLNMDAWSACATGEGSEFGMAVNPHNPRHLPGGSSSGAGVAVAAGLVDVALGTDTAGSARIPASWCGTVALKPTHNAVPSLGAIGLDPTLDSVCPLARTVSECAVLYKVLTSSAVRSSHGPWRVGVVRGVIGGCDTITARALGDAAGILTDAGSTVEVVDIPLWMKAWEMESILLALSVPYWVETGWQGRWRRDHMLPPAPGSNRDAPQLIRLWSSALEALGGAANELYYRTCEARIQLAEQVSDAFQQFDLLLTPTTPSAAPPCAPLHERSLLSTSSGAATSVVTSTLTTPANLTGIPALSVPFGKDDFGLPAAVQIHADHNREDILFAAAALLEAVAS